VDALLVALVLVVFVGVLQLWLDRRARQAPKDGERFWLHLGKTNHGPVVLDQDGRTLRGIRHLQYRAAHGHVDTLVLEVIARTPEGHALHAGRRIGSAEP
jgi:hypothetical protein